MADRAMVIPRSFICRALFDCLGILVRVVGHLYQRFDGVGDRLAALVAAVGGRVKRDRVGVIDTEHPPVDALEQ
jgi:hypothetical protein